MIRPSLVVVSIIVFVFSVNTSCQKKGKNNNATDTLTYEIKSLVNSYNNCNTDSPECTNIAYSYPVFVTSSATADSLNSYVKFILGEKAGGNTLQKTQENFIKDYVLYISNKTTDSIAAWYSQTRIDVPYQHNKIVSLKIEMDDYTGGAHGLISTAYQVFDKTTSKVLIQTNLIKKDKAQALLALAEKAFRKDAELADDADLEKAGYWFKENSFYLTENYCITAEGITWLYNPYEIAAYSLGTIELFLSKEEMLPFIEEQYKDIWD